MIEILEMGAAPVVEKIIAPIIKPAVSIVPQPKGSSILGWVILLLVVCVIGYILYQELKEEPEEMELKEVLEE